MNIKDFVKDALIQIAEGVHEANDKLRVFKAEANPQKIKRILQVGGPHTSTEHNMTQTISFDIAVTVQETSENGTNGGINIYAVQLQGNGNKSRETSNTSRLKFDVPLKLPPPVKQMGSQT